MKINVCNKLWELVVIDTNLEPNRKLKYFHRNTRLPFVMTEDEEWLMNERIKELEKIEKTINETKLKQKSYKK